MSGDLKPILSWRGEIAKADLAPATKLVAYALSLYMNELGGSAHPGPTRLAAETGLNISTVKERLSALEKDGWLTCTARGGFRKGEKKHANVYEATFPQSVLFIHNPSPQATVASGDPSSQMKATVASGDPICPSISPTKTARAKPEPVYNHLSDPMTAEQIKAEQWAEKVEPSKVRMVREAIRMRREHS